MNFYNKEMKLPIIANKYTINTTSLFQYDIYLFQKNSWDSIFVYDNSIFVYDNNKNLIFCIKKKHHEPKKTKLLKTGFKNFLIVLDTNKETEILKIDRSSEKYGIRDMVINKDIGYIKQKTGLMKDEWIFYSNNDEKIGKMNKQYMAFSIISKLFGVVCSFIDFGVSWLIPQIYIITSSDGMDVANIKKQYNLFTFKNTTTLTILQANSSIDQRLLISMGILIAKG